MVGRLPMLVAVLGLATLGCRPDPEPRAGALGADGQPEPTAVELTPERLAELKERYPVLREEDAAEPQPTRLAAPGEVPDRIREHANGMILQTVHGGATFYADKFEGQRTASGIPFRQNQMVAAHRGFPFGTVLRVTNLQNGRQVNVRVVDRGPFGAGSRAERTIIDLSRRAAAQLDYVEQSRAQVRVEVLEWGEGISA
jgi:rare lipoprotein A